MKIIMIAIGIIYLCIPSIAQGSSIAATRDYVNAKVSDRRTRIDNFAHIDTLFGNPQVKVTTTDEPFVTPSYIDLRMTDVGNSLINIDYQIKDINASIENIDSIIDSKIEESISNSVATITETGNIFTPWEKEQYSLLYLNDLVTPQSLSNAVIRYSNGTWHLDGELDFQDGNYADKRIIRTYQGNENETEIVFYVEHYQYVDIDENHNEIYDWVHSVEIICSREFIRYGNLHGLALYDDILQTITPSNNYFSNAVANVAFGMNSEISDIVSDYISTAAFDYTTSQITNIVNNIFNNNDGSLINGVVSVGGAIALLFGLVALLIKDLGSAKRYDLVEITSSDTHVKDRAINFMSQGAVSLEFPKPVNGKARDFALIFSSVNASVLIPSGATVVQDFGSEHKINNGIIACDTTKNFVVAITEIRYNYFYIRIMETIYE